MADKAKLFRKGVCDIYLIPEKLNLSLIKLLPNEILQETYRSFLLCGSDWQNIINIQGNAKIIKKKFL